MASGVDVAATWSSFRRGQAMGAVVCMLLALWGAWGILDGDVAAGGGVLLVFGVLAALAVVNARSGRRGSDAARTEVHDGFGELVFPTHLVGALLTTALTAALVLGPLAGAAWLGLLALRGSGPAGVGALLLLSVTGWGLWLTSRLPGGHRGWPSVRLSQEGVEVRGVFKGSFLRWDEEPVPVPWANGVLRLIPSARLHSMADSATARRKDSWTAQPGWIGPTAIDADLGVVAAAVLFYDLNPDRRVELGSQAAVQRVRSGELRPPWSVHLGAQRRFQP